MKPTLKNSLAIFYPQGFLDGENAKLVIEAQDISYLASKQCSGALISLKKVVFFNKRGLSTSVDLLNQIQEKTGAIIGFCDYDRRKYKTILDMYDNKISFSLFETEKVATLFATTPILKDEYTENILVYNDDVEHKNQLAVELIERGYTPVVPKNENQFLEMKKECKYVVSDSYVRSTEKQIKAHIKDNVIVYSLPTFVDSEIAEIFDMKYHTNTLRVGFKHFLFDAQEVTSLNIHGVNFLSKLSTAGAEYGANIAICELEEHNITPSLKNDIEDAGILLYESMDAFFKDDDFLKSDGAGQMGNKPRHITKKVVSVLPLIAQTAMYTVEMMTRCIIVKKSIKIQSLDIQNKSQMMSAAIAFYGDLDGFLLLAFDKEIAKKSCKILIEESDMENESEMLNALGEFVNIIGGKIINEMSKKHYKLEITMPRTYGSLDEVISLQKDTKGAQIDFEVDGKPLILFLTK